MAPSSRICFPAVAALSLLLTACGADSTDETTTDTSTAGEGMLSTTDTATAGGATLSASSWAAEETLNAAADLANTLESQPPGAATVTFSIRNQTQTWTFDDVRCTFDEVGDKFRLLEAGRDDGRWFSLRIVANRHEAWLQDAESQDEASVMLEGGGHDEFISADGKSVSGKTALLDYVNQDDWPGEDVHIVPGAFTATCP